MNKKPIEIRSNHSTVHYFYCLFISLVFLLFHSYSFGQTGSANLSVRGVGSEPMRNWPEVVGPAAFSGSENPVTGNFNMTIPIVSLKGRGLDTNISLVYNSAIYQYVGEGLQEVGDYAKFPGKGFSAGFGALITHNARKQCNIVQVGGYGFCPASMWSPNFPQPPTFVDPSGARHRFVGNLATDSSAIRYDSGTVTSPGIVTYPDGTKVIFGGQFYERYADHYSSDIILGSGTAYCRNECDVYDRIDLPTKIEDRNGNYITISYVSANTDKISSVTDTLGRTFSFVYQGNTLSKITMTGFGGSPVDIALFHHFTDGYNNQFVRDVIFPATDTGYYFEYDRLQIKDVQKLKDVVLNPDGSLSSNGTILARTEYTYSQNGYPYLTSRHDSWLRNPSQSTTDYQHRQYNFSFQFFDSANLSVTDTVSVEDGSIHRNTKRWYTPHERATIQWHILWDDGVVFDESLIKDGIVLGSRSFSYQHAVNYAVRPVFETQTNEAGQTTRVEYSYPGDPPASSNYTRSLTNPSEVRVYGYDGGLMRRTEITYETDTAWTNRWLVQLVKTVKVFGPGTTPASLTEYFYDETGLGACPNIISNTSGLPLQRGNLTSIKSYPDSNNAATAISVRSEYDIAGNTIKSIDAEGNINLFDFNDNFGFPDGEARANTPPSSLGSQVSYAFATRATNPLGWMSYSQYDYFIGATVNTEDINGVISKSLYDAQTFRPAQIVTGVGTALESQASSIFDDANLTITHSADLNALNDNLIKTVSIVDGLGHLIETRTYESATDYRVVQTEYDVFGRAYRQSNPFRPVEIDVNHPILWTQSYFDDLWRITKVKTPDNAEITTSYFGNITTGTDQAGKVRRSLTNALGQLVRIDEPNGAGQLGSVENPSQPTSYVYDPLGNLKTVIQGSQTRTFLHNGLSQLVSATNPESGTITYVYDNNGNVTSKIDARMITTSYAYDAVNRMTQRSYSDGVTPPVTYIYDDKPYAKGKLTKVASSVSTTEYTAFDQLGRITEHQQTTDGAGGSTSYSYKLDGSLYEETYPSGRTVKNTLGANGNISQVETKASGGNYTNRANNFVYNAAGVVQSVQLGNGKYETTQFNARMQPTQIGLGTSTTDTSLLRLQYGYGTTANNGNVQSQTITVPTVGTTAGFTAIQNYTYDALNRLESATENENTTDRVNHALASNGGTATASSIYSSDFPTGSINNGDRKGAVWGSGGAWSDATFASYPDWVQVDFSGSKTISEIDVVTLQDTYWSPSEPTENMTFANYGITDFDVQYWNGSAWTTVPGGSITGNDKVWKKITFSPITTTKIRVVVNSSLANWSRITEVEAWGPRPAIQNFALASKGGTASASSVYSSDFPTGSINNGDRKGAVWGSGGAWSDATFASYPDWVQVDFSGSKTISEIDVVTLQDTYWSPSEPTENMTFANYGITDFDVQYWNGSAWTTVPGGSITGNDKVWKKITFSPITTTKIRVVVNSSLANWSRIVEVEAWGSAASTQTWKQTFTHDRYGNRRFDQAATTVPASFSNQAQTNPTISATSNRLTSAGYVYDNSGNTTGDAFGRTFAYDGANKQVSVSNSGGNVGTYYYDGDGKRVKTVSAAGTTIFIYDADGRLIEETTTPPTYCEGDICWPTYPVTTSYVYAGPRLLSTESTNGMTNSTTYLTPDHLGSPRISTDRFGNVVARHDYHPYGEEVTSPQRTGGLGYGQDGVRKRFTGYERDQETGLDFAEARYLTSTLGRFSAPDPFMASARLDDPQSTNRYTYVLNNPLNLVDPSGLCPPVNNSPCVVGDRWIEGNSIWHKDAATGEESWLSLDSLDVETVHTSAPACSRANPCGNSNPSMGFQAPLPPRPGVTFNNPVKAPGTSTNFGRMVLRQTLKGVAASMIGPTLIILAAPATVHAPTGSPVPGGGERDRDRDPMQTVYRVYGGGSAMYGPSWTPVDPRTVKNYRDAAGLPTWNTGEWLVQGTVRTSKILEVRPALSLHGNRGGLPEYRIHPMNVTIIMRTRVNPPF